MRNKKIVLMILLSGIFLIKSNALLQKVKKLCRWVSGFWNKDESIDELKHVSARK